MANNKVQLANGTVLIDITDTTATTSDVAQGKYFYGADGIKLAGTHTDPMARGTGTDSVISVSETNPNTASGGYAFAVGRSNNASGDNSVAMGYNSLASGLTSIAIGGTVSGKTRNQATQAGAVAIGQSNQSSGYYSIAMGRESVASGAGAVALGYGNTALGNGSFAAGGFTTAGARCSSALGNGTNANGGNSLVAGKFNVIDNAEAAATTGEREFALIIGNGTDDSNRSNAATLDWDGNAVFAGKATVGAAPVNDLDVATKKYVDDNAGGGGTSDYTDLTNKPQINGNTLTGNKTAASLGLIAAPSSPATGAFLVYNGTAWVAQTLAAWQGGSY